MLYKYYLEVLNPLAMSWCLFQLTFWLNW